jgi:Na+-transporting NADH:ubiquinone oxidoreductase subunit NqrC
MKSTIHEYQKNNFKNMSRKVILIIALVLVSNTIFAQSVFDKFDNQDDITTIIVNKKMFSMLSKVDAKDKASQQYLNLIKKLDNLKVFVTGSDKKSDDMKAVADKYIKTAGLEELMRINEKGKNVKIYVKSGATNSEIKELLMFIEGSGKEESVLMSLTGSFDLDELSALTEKMNLPGGDELKKASKK